MKAFLVWCGKAMAGGLIVSLAYIGETYFIYGQF